MGGVYLTWLLDSIFNDVCVLFVGFSPIEDALDTVAAARELGASSALGIFSEMEDTENEQNAGRGEDEMPANSVVGKATAIDLDEVELEQEPRARYLSDASP